ncbi:MAG: DNA-directed RNA polymerase subunit beta' [Patescibacteria group bacterium]|nr:DNA-directed RNA polymerase subunit beta' [Patescibacteria group bacterium]
MYKNEGADRPEDLDFLKINLASPEQILKWSHGEVLKPETINYRTQRPEKDGLFSERIFGPSKDYECYCGKYKRIRYKGVVCDKCGVEVTRSIVRRERMGHIELAAPVAHIWFLKAVPSRLALVLNVSSVKLERVLYYISYIVTKVDEETRIKSFNEVDKELKAKIKSLGKNKGSQSEFLESAKRTKDFLKKLKPGMILDQSEYLSWSRKFGSVFEAEMGAGAIRKILENMDLRQEAQKIEKEISLIKDPLKERKLLYRLKIFKSMIKNSIRPEWMVMNVLPVLPPDLRPMVALDGGRYATSDLNDLYRRVINRNNRLKKLIEIKAPDIIIKNEKRMLQEAVDALIDNSARYGTQQLSSQRRPLRSLADILKGKQGRFRQNLLGKRVDYSGRSVIVVGPHLKIDECGLPKRMALEMFRPFVIGEMMKRGIAHNIRNANRFIEEGSDEVWAILEEVIKDRRVLLNRAPTLHRLSIQAFKPILIEGMAIQLPPLVCSGFNADFDGDQMAVHLPLSVEAQKESQNIMSAKINILKPASGDIITNPTQDIVLGIYYLTNINQTSTSLLKGKLFGNIDEALMAYEEGLILVNTPIKAKINGAVVDTSLGRLLFNEVFEGKIDFVNDKINKKKLSALVEKSFEIGGIDFTYEILNKIQLLGFKYATVSGITWSIGDLMVPEAKKQIVAKAEREVEIITKQFQEGLLTSAERKARVISIWEKVKDEVSKALMTIFMPNNPIYQIIDSSARGSWAQPIQMSGMKGLVVNPKGETIELPIKSSYKEGLSVLEYFISTHGARKGSTDTALKTAQAGYMTRRLVDVSQDLMIKEEDCGTKKGVEVFRADTSEFGYPFSSRIFSRTALEDIKLGNKIIVRAGETINKEAAELIEKSKIESVKVRSPITCKTLYGLCGKCYGYDLGKNKPVEVGEAVGVIAAQSIGEPGTQLTMRTFHSGGIAGVDITQGLPRVEEIFEVRPPKGKAVLAAEDGKVIDIEERSEEKIIRIKSKTGLKSKAAEYAVSRYALVYVKPGDNVKQGDRLSEGSIDLKELLLLKGIEETERYVIKEIQKIYFSQGSLINDKHIEIMIKQMFSRLKITDPGDAPDLVVGEIVEKSKFLEINRELKKQGLQLAKSQQLLMGIKRVALSTESWLSAASFEDTARILVTAGLEGKSDSLRGLKENVIIGRLIPTKETFAPGGEIKVMSEEEIEEPVGEVDVVEEAPAGEPEEPESLTDESKSDNV